MSEHFIDYQRNLKKRAELLNQMTLDRRKLLAEYLFRVGKLPQNNVGILYFSPTFSNMAVSIAERNGKLATKTCDCGYCILARLRGVKDVEEFE
jgi:hypothetical protein